MRLEFLGSSTVIVNTFTVTWNGFKFSLASGALDESLRH
jgi:hypothetical protein